MVLAAGLGTRMRPLTDKHAEAAGRGRRQAADRSRARPAGGGRRRARGGQRASLRRADRAPSRRAQAAADRRSPTSAACCSAPAAAWSRRCRSSARRRSSTSIPTRIWIDGVKPNLARLADAFDPAAMDALLLLAPTTGSIGYAGRGDFAMAPDGRLRRRGRARGGAVRLCRRRDPVARAVHGRAAGRILAAPCCSTAPRSKAACYGLRLEGLWMHVGTPDAIALAENAIRAQHGLIRPARGSVYDSAMPAAKANVFTIPASAPFLPTLIDALRAGKLVPGFPGQRRSARTRASATLYLPTRRACRLARDAFLDELESRRRHPAAHRRARRPRRGRDRLRRSRHRRARATTRSTLPPAIGALERRLLLAELIAQWAAAHRARARRAADRQYAGGRARRSPTISRA